MDPIFKNNTYIKSTWILLILVFITTALIAQDNKNAQNKEKQDLKQAYILAQGLEDAGRIKRALKLYQQIYNKNPNNTELVNRYTSLLIQEKEYDKARKVLKRYLDKNPEDFQAKIKLGEIHYEEGQEEEGLQNWTDLYQNNIRNRAVHRTLFDKFLKLEEYEHSIEMVTFLREKLNNKHYLANEVGDLYKQREEYNRAAEEYLSYALERDKLNLAEQKLLSLPDSMEVFNQIRSPLENLVDQEDNIDVLQLYKKVLFKYGKYERAQDIVFEIEDRSNYPGKFSIEFGKNLVKEGQDSLARNIFNRILNTEQLQQVHRTALMELADLYRNIFSSDQTANVLQFYRPHNYFFDYSFYQQSQEEAKYLQEAFSIYDTLLTMDKVQFSARVNYRLGNLSLYATRDFDRALEFYQKSLSQTNKQELQIKCIKKIIHTRLAKGEMEKVRQELNEHRKNLGEQGRTELLSTQLLLDFYAKHSQVDSLANDVLEQIDFSHQHYNDILELLNFVRSNKQSDGYEKFIEGEILLRQDNLARARSKYESIIQNHPESTLNNEAFFRAAQLNLYFDKQEKAQKYISQIDTADKFKSEAIYMLARTMDQKEKYQIAEKWYARLMQEYPDYLDLETVRERLRKIKNK